MVISSRTTGTTVLRPSSSSMISFISSSSVSSVGLDRGVAQGNRRRKCSAAGAVTIEQNGAFAKGEKVRAQVGNRVGVRWSASL